LATKLCSPSRRSQIQHHTTPETKDDLSDGDRGSSVRIHTVIGNIDVSWRKREFLVRAYFFDNDDRRTADLSVFMGGRALSFNLLLVCTYSHTTPTPGVITQDVQRLNTKNHSSTRAIQSVIFPHNIVAEMNKVDHLHHQNMAPASFYFYIRAAINLIQKLDPGIVFRISIAIMNMNTTTHINIVDLPSPNNEPRVVLPLPEHNLYVPQTGYRRKRSGPVYERAGIVEDPVEGTHYASITSHGDNRATLHSRASKYIDGALPESFPGTLG
jgi:hypothetical protein